MTKFVRVDPRDFVSPPFIKCPKCGEDSFGILMISDGHYSRRCKECLYPHPRRSEPSATYSLPELDKKIIYIDQFAISNMMKALNPQTTAYKKGKIDKFWTLLFERLYRLCNMQLIICPDSIFHRTDSLFSPYYQPLKRMYELLSHGLSFYDHDTIKRFQISQHARNWITGNSDGELNLDVHSIISGNTNAWQDRFIVSLNLNYDSHSLDSLRKDRKRIHEGYQKVFSRWRTEKNRGFDDWFKEELASFGKTTLESYLRYVVQYIAISTGRAPWTIDIAYPPAEVALIHSIQGIFRNEGVKDCDMWPETLKYLESPSLVNIPFRKISCMLYAAIARKAAAGRKRPPNKGMSNDIEIISILLPYCDAMFMDNECHSYLREQPLCEEINYGKEVFSQNTKNEFLNCLNEIEEAVSKEHIEKLNEVYGANWRTPFTTIYSREQKEE
jgi:hypothetical protein